MEILTGEITEIIYHNEGNGFTVAIFETEKAVITITGNLAYVNPGAVYKLEGKYKTHQKYGEQFAFYSFKEILPNDVSSIQVFLSSGAIKGIGPKMAEQLVAEYGEKTLDVIENNHMDILKIRGIGSKTAEKIHNSYVIRKEFANIAFELEKWGITTTYALKIYKEYESKAVQMIKENPYRLIEDIYGISFHKADEIAQKLGISKESEYRVKSGIIYCLNQYIGSGNTYVLKEVLIDKAVEVLDLSSEMIEDNIVTLAFDGTVQVDDLEGAYVVYISGYYYAEKKVCNNLIRLKDGLIKPISYDLDNLLAKVQAEENISLSEEQKKAVKSSLRSNVSVITGGPGTGKTTIINTIIKIATICGITSAIAAPTGRAAKRITETSGYEASTIHRLLEYHYSTDSGEAKFLKNQDSMLEQDLIIIDEASMIDLMLMSSMLDAISTGTRVILVGDANQLPSVGAGNVLRDFIYSEFIPTIKLNEIFRQAKESLIVVNAHLINKGEYPCFNERDKDFFLINIDNEKDMLNKIIELVSGRIETYYDFVNSPSDIQVLTPSRKGTLGTHNLNKRLQEVLNPKKPGVNEKVYGDKTFRVGDKVMQIRNDYQIKWRKEGSLVTGDGIFNGDMGLIKEIDKENDTITVIFDNEKYVSYESSQLDLLELAYAITVHKSQGSEFPAVIIPMTWFPPMLATRNLFYTGITRGKNLVTIVGSEKRMKAMIDNNRIENRCSGLGIRLKRIDLMGLNI
ncbi:MAG: ATP-dependent RecD-like DNA helicase [Peptostreptococcaceae bacterium]|nr:ATP-dependent RecD-like DNA helicase [Peptostreptococcaceae bacterium]